MEYLSQERYNEIADELEHLIKVEFPRLTQELAEARAQGDLSENFEYHACKREQGKMMSRIRFLQHVLEYAKVIDTTLLSADTVGLFRKVTVTNLAQSPNSPIASSPSSPSGHLAASPSSQRTYTLVNPHEANLTEGKLSIQSPIGSALKDHKVGDIVSVTVPAGTLHLRIDKIEV